MEIIMIGKRDNWRSVVVLLWISYSIVTSDITKKPVDTEVRIGDSTFLNCSTSDASEDLNWYHQPVGRGSSDLRYVFMGGQLLRPYNDRFRIEKDSSAKAFNLVISNVEVEDAGRYICQNGKGAPATAELIVLESLPTCMSNINSGGIIGPNSCQLMKESIRLSCGINYNGNIPPRLQWERIKHDKSFPISEPCVASDGRITCNYTAEADMEMDGSSFICQSNRSIDAQYNCTTENVKILYSAENKTRISNTVGDEVSCFANTSSTDCKYNWIWFDGIDQETVSEGRTLIINREGLHRCEATCSIKDFRCLVNAMTVKASFVSDPPVKDSPAAVVVGCALGVVVLFCLCIIGVLLTRLCKRKGDRKNDPSELGQPLLANNDELKAKDVVIENKNKEIEDKNAGIRKLQNEVAALRLKIEINEVAELKDEKNELVARSAETEANNVGNKSTGVRKMPGMTLRNDQESENNDVGMQPRWTCNKCTFSNMEESVPCTMCSTPKSHELLAADEKSLSEDVNKTGTKRKQTDK